ncbi:MAG: hypothetical protein ACRD1T_16290, partial [Acidimicrobiia bacterium]
VGNEGPRVEDATSRMFRLRGAHPDATARLVEERISHTDVVESVVINDQWRVIFPWKKEMPTKSSTTEE